MRGRKGKPHCPRCRHPGFWRIICDSLKPRFQCDKCGDTWSCGRDGGNYNGAEMGSRVEQRRSA